MNSQHDKDMGSTAAFLVALKLGDTEYIDLLHNYADVAVRWYSPTT